MKRVGGSLLLLFLWASAFAASPEPATAFDLDSQPVAQIMRVIYIEALRERPYFLDPAVLQDQRLVSFRYGAKDGEFRTFLGSFLRSLGYFLEEKNRADFIRPVPQAEKPSIAEDSNMEVFHYRPRYRDGSYLVEMLTPLFRGKFTSQRAISASAAAPSSTQISGSGAGGGGAIGSTQPVAPSGSPPASE